MAFEQNIFVISNTNEGDMEISVINGEVVFQNTETDATHVFFTIQKTTGLP
jgi:hypothetical protein